jgi:hypothetical protein
MINDLITDRNDLGCKLLRTIRAEIYIGWNYHRSSDVVVGLCCLDLVGSQNVLDEARAVGLRKPGTYSTILPNVNLLFEVRLEFSFFHVVLWKGILSINR